jgi:steroid delta-isomerase-like uncharacterized protein
MSLEANKQLLERYQAAWSAGDIEQLRQMLHEDCNNYNLVTGERRNIEFELEACRIWHSGFSDTQVEIQQIFAEEDRVCVYWMLTAVHTRDFIGIAPTNRHVQIPGMEFNRIIEGKIIDIWRLSDTMSVMQQLGAVFS